MRAGSEGQKKMLDKKPRTRVATLNARVGRWHESRSYKRSKRADSNTWYDSKDGSREAMPLCQNRRQEDFVHGCVRDMIWRMRCMSLSHQSSDLIIISGMHQPHVH